LKICADENVSPLLTGLIRAELLSPRNTLHTVDDFQARSVEDEIWVRRFALAGGEVIVGADGRMLSRPHEVAAISDTGLRLVVLPSNWVRQRKHVQIAFLFYWWPRIERWAEAAKPGQCCKVPWSWTEQAEVIPRSVDLQTARKKIKKAEKKRRKGT
jgi:hypothetical protein